jgi:hypothetical protein
VQSAPKLGNASAVTPPGAQFVTEFCRVLIGAVTGDYAMICSALSGGGFPEHRQVTRNPVRFFRGEPESTSSGKNIST